MRVVRTRFPTGNQNYDYFIQPGDNPETGDFVITSFEHDENEFIQNRPPVLRVATVVDLLDPQDRNKASKPYLQLIPLKFLIERRREQAALIQHEAAKREARGRLLALAAERSEDMLFESLAKDNPEAAKLLATLRAPFPSKMIEGN